MSDSVENLIDKSARAAVSFFLASAGLWLLVAAALAYIVAAKSTDPSFLGNCEFLTYGKAKAAQANAFVYGWGSNSVFAVGFWLLARLGRAEVRGRFYLIIAGAVWNLAITLGLGGIFAGQMTSFDLMEMPVVIWPMLFISYFVIAALALVLMVPIPLGLCSFAAVLARIVLSTLATFAVWATWVLRCSCLLLGDVGLLLISLL